MPRVRFVSATFLVAFGLGAFVGIGLALLAVALATPEKKTTIVQPEIPAAVAPAPTVTPSPEPTPEATSTPLPSITTNTTLSVRIGPDEQYAILGTIARGGEVDVIGRDIPGDWLAISFPPGSSATGWVPAGAIDGLSTVQVFRLEVMQPTTLATSPARPTSTTSPFASPTPSVLEGNDGLPVATRTTPVRNVDDEDEPAATPTPRSVHIGPTDLVVASATVDSSGRIIVVVGNQGPGDILGETLAIEVSAPGVGTETFVAQGVLSPGESQTFRTQMSLTGETNVRVTIDPGSLLTDLNRANNVLNLNLNPPPS